MSKKIKSNRVLNCAKELDAIKSANTVEKRRDLIRKAKDCVIDSISELALNCLKGNIPLKTCDFKTLKKHKKVLRQISKKSPVVKRKKVLIQEGGQLLPILIASGLGYFGRLAFNKLKEEIEKRQK